MDRRTLAAALAAGALGASAMPPALADPGEKISICHRTNSMSNPYVLISANVAAVNGRGGKGDHYANHTGGVWTPDAERKSWGDIIPPLPGVHAGRNWTLEGQSIWLNGCKPLLLAPVIPGIDTDNDGDPDVTDLDDDGDETPDTLDQDDDSDGNPDLTEPETVTAPTDPDIDGDGTPASEDSDDDNDGQPDVTDPDSDGDGIPKGEDPDEDNNGVVDPGAPDQDQDGNPDITDLDDDGDGTPDTKDPDKDNDSKPNRVDPDDDGDRIRDPKDPSSPSSEVLVVEEDTPDNSGEWADVLIVERARPDGTGKSVVRATCATTPAAGSCDVRVMGRIVQLQATCATSVRLRVVSSANNARPSVVTKTYRIGKRSVTAAGEVSPQAC